MSPITDQPVGGPDDPKWNGAQAPKVQMVRSTETGATEGLRESTLPALPLRSVMLIRLSLIGCVSLLVTGGVAEPAAGKADWTVLAYLSGDGSLEDVALGYLRELAAVPGSDRVCLVAQVDRAPGYSREFDDFTDTRRIAFVTREAGQRRHWLQRAWHDEVNMGDPQTLTGFALAGIEAFPAEHYLLLLLGHGTGVRELAGPPEAAPAESGIGWDATSGGDALTVREVGDACRQIAAACQGQQISLLALDACFSATAELACEVAPAVECLTGSPGLIYEPGVPWSEVLSSLVGKPQMEPRELAALAVASIEREYAQGGHPGAAYLAADLELAPELQSVLDALCRELESRMDEVLPLVTRAREQAPTSGPQWEMRELPSLLAALAGSAKKKGLNLVAEEADAALEIAEQMVLSTYAEDAGDGQGSCRGWAVFFPPSLSIFPADYLTSSSFARDAGWGPFVASYLKHLRELVTRTPDREAHSATQATVDAPLATSW